MPLVLYPKFESLNGSAVDLNKDLNVTQNQRKNKKSGKSEKSDLCLFGYKAFFCRFDNSFTDIYISNIIDYSTTIKIILNQASINSSSWLHGAIQGIVPVNLSLILSIADPH